MSVVCAKTSIIKSSYLLLSYNISRQLHQGWQQYKMCPYDRADTGILKKIYLPLSWKYYIKKYLEHIMYSLSKTLYPQ
jgi:hypothetical protein